jgi:hypothetical protein
MLRFACAGVLTVLVLPSAGPFSARAAEGDKDVKAIVAKAIEAKGGEANLKKYKASVSKFKGVVSVMGIEVAMTGTAKDQVPDKIRMDAAMKFGGQDVTFSQIINGDKGWQGLNGEFMELDKDALAEAREQVHASQVTDLRELKGKGVKVSSLGESKVDGKSAVGVLVKADGYRDISLYFDKDSGKLVKSETKGKDPMGGAEFKAETFFSDYKKVSGVNVPHKVKVLRDGSPFMQMEISAVTLSEKLDDKDFTKP